MSLEKNMDNEDDDDEEELLVPDEDDLKYVKESSENNSSSSSTVGSDPYGVEEQKNIENNLKSKIHDVKQEREKLRRALSFEDTDNNTSSLFSVAKTTKLDDDEVKDETYDPYRSAWWEQVNQELNNEFENVSKECESLRQKIAIRNKREKSSSRRSSGKKRSSSSSRRSNMNKCVFGDNSTLHDE